MYNNGNNSNSNFYGNQNPYMYGNPYQSQTPIYQSPFQQQMMNRPQTQQLTFVSGKEGAKAYIVPPNQTIYLKDSDSEMLWVKSADMQGKYYMQCYKLIPFDTDSPKQDTSKIEYASQNEFNSFKESFDKRLNDLFSQVEKLNKQAVSRDRNNDNRNNQGRGGNKNE